ncbi:methionyl-tRNA synthetase [Nannizzia gypsea CBS 118893]|uniref:Probable methionine--tRNA ligase, mitochondrial n=1 Tax=Arthroderma gypseum (strain ATCC MYA-4604 / CBS 118893) TaxID=535722 RepID=E4UVY4_ARTGP|nr:methionyl-tRNA synthetase [Nannizzia gypsea CBS 118893]EFR01645.1 methionyl-tRNA synthetase [Nannizzia gypsea CBS 118893]
MLKAELRTVSRSVKFRKTKPNAWIYGSYRHAGNPWQHLNRGYATEAKSGVKSKPYYVTTPIFYVNAAPHIGHLYTILIADILKRWQVLIGNGDAKLLTGTDEHGMKIQQAALQNGLEPQALCDRNCETFKILAREANASHDHFIRTTDSAHKAAVQFFWENLNHRGYIYEGKHEGWYSVSDETFYPASAVHSTLDPATGRKMMASIETGKEVKFSQETNYHFKLSAFQDRLLEHYHKNPNFVRPKVYMDSIVQNVASGLQDLSISRPVDRLSWGIPVPGDTTQTIYVWLDALVNYITYAGYPFTPGREQESIWPADVQVVGKDITRFHCIYWPAFLMALDLPLPRTILTHAHWTMNHSKMSKSTGNVVNPMFAMARYGVDPMRFYLAMNGGLASDTDYDNSYIVRDYKNILQGGLGNLCSRVMRGKGWNVRESVARMTGGQRSGNAKDPSEIEHKEFLEKVPALVSNQMDELNPRRALEEVVKIIDQTNRYVQSTGPWNLAKDAATNPIAHDRLVGVIFNATESLRIAGILLQPFMPEKAKKLLDMLGVEEDLSKRSYAAAKYGADPDYGTPRVPLGKGQAGTLFPPLLSEE